ncbi:MAG: DUF4834 family protein [Prevotellaceae bacterium]|jgi:hypothetical protein|nr:DUF4834 family protein [Prevotellaceae bacterium]
MKYLITFIAILIILSWFFRIIKWYFAKNFFNINGSANRSKTYYKTRKQGDVHIDKQPARDKKIKDDVGEYIDYEEIK